MSALPKIGNLAWAPEPDLDNIEVLDRFNGVPTLGLFTGRGERQLFWRVEGYLSDKFSAWLYVPVTGTDEARVRCEADPLAGLLFGSPEGRYVTVGVASDYRLIFEREWFAPAGATPLGLLRDLLRFLDEALSIASEQDLPPSRRQLVRDASRAVRELTAR